MFVATTTGRLQGVTPSYWCLCRCW